MSTRSCGSLLKIYIMGTIKEKETNKNVPMPSKSIQYIYIMKENKSKDL